MNPDTTSASRPSAPLPSITALHASHDRFRSILSSLTPEKIRDRAYPSEWSIAQVASHLGSGAEISLLNVNAGVAGTEPPSRDDFPRIWDTWNAKSPDAQVADGIASNTRFVERVEGLTDEQLATARFQLWFGETDVNGLVTSRLFEHAVHTWDVAVAVDPAAHIATDALPLILGGINVLIGFAAKPNGRTGRVRFVTEIGEYALTLGESTTLEPWTGGDDGPRVDVPAEALVRLIYGRLDPAHTPATVTTSGIELDDLRAVFPGV